MLSIAKVFPVNSLDIELLNPGLNTNLVDNDEVSYMMGGMIVLHLTDNQFYTVCYRNGSRSKCKAVGDLEHLKVDAVKSNTPTIWTPIFE